MTFIEIINSVKDGGKLDGEALAAFNGLPDSDKANLARTLKQDYGVTVTGVKVLPPADEPEGERGKAIDNPAVNPMEIKDALRRKMIQEGDDPARVTSVDAVVMIDGEDIKTVAPSATEPVNAGSKGAVPASTHGKSAKDAVDEKKGKGGK